MWGCRGGDMWGVEGVTSGDVAVAMRPDSGGEK